MVHTTISLRHKEVDRMIYRNSKEIVALYHHGKNVIRVMHNGKCVYNGCNTTVGTVPMTFRSSAGFINQYQIWGNIQQNGTPAPENPVEVQGVGKLITEGEYSGKYEIPVVTRSENQEPVTTSIFLGEPLYKGDYIIKDKSGGKVHRKWGVKVFDGTENIIFDSERKRFYNNIIDLKTAPYARLVRIYNNFYTVLYNTEPFDIKFDNVIYVGSMEKIIYIHDKRFTTTDDFKSFLASEYAKGTPVTVYYPLATPTEEEIELPDIPTIKGWNIVDVATDVKPEKISLTYRR